jgi:hypothetical protein
MHCAGTSRLEVDCKPLTRDENAFAFHVSWAGPNDSYFVSDGKIRKRSVNGGDAQTMPVLIGIRRAFGELSPISDDDVGTSALVIAISSSSKLHETSLSSMP